MTTRAYTVNEVSELLGVKGLTVYRLIKSGRLQAFRVGTRTVRVEQKALDAFIESARIVSKKRKR